MKSFSVLLLMLLSSTMLVAQNRSIDSLHQALNSTSDQRSKIKTLIELCWEYRFINAEKARTFGLEALELAKKEGIEELEVEALSNVGITHEAQGNYTEALDYQFKAIKIREKLGNDLKTANTINNIGVIYDEKGDYAKAIEYYLKARKIYERLNDQGKIAMVLSNIGIVLRAQKDYKNSIANYRQALGIYERLGNDFGVAACHANLGSVYLNLHDYDSALYYSLLATDEFQQQNIRQFLPSTLTNAAIAYDTLGLYSKARELMLQAKALNEEYDNKKELAHVLIQLGRLYGREKQFTTALAYANQGLELAERIEALEQVMQAREVLSKIKAWKKDFAGAYDDHIKYTDVKDSLFKIEKAKQLMELQTKYETDKKEQEINIQKLVINEQRLKLSRNQFIILGLILLVSFGVVIFLLWRSQQKYKEQKLAEETQRKHQEELTKAIIQLQEIERSRFAKDLHDGFGQLITALKMQVEKTGMLKDGIPELIQHMHDEIRNVSFALSPQVLTRDGLVHAVRELAFRINRGGVVNVSVQTTGFNERLDVDYETTLYRVCQEWINNVLKYSSASQINIQLIEHDDEVTLMIEDNGTGFDASILNRSMGNGWRNIESRVQLVKGLVEVDSAPTRKGTTFTASIPNRLGSAIVA
jgi:two-component system NarL family sensor kinase